MDYACSKLCNIWLLLFGVICRNYHQTGASHSRKISVAVISQDRVIVDNLKRQIKNRTLYTGRYISNWSKVFEHLPTLFLFS